MMNEQLSAYLDGEATPQETDNLFAALKRDADLRGTFSRQHWLRHALRENSPVGLDSDFSARVMLSLDDESISNESHSTVVPLQQPQRSTRRWHKPAAGMALAASVVGAMVLINYPSSQGDNGFEEAQLAPNQTMAMNETAMAPQATQVALQTQTETRQVSPPDHWSVSDPALEDQLNSYLLEHDGIARGYGLSGATPSLVRVATYGTGQ